eukprot:1329057-Amphidinium_carterae.1
MTCETQRKTGERDTGQTVALSSRPVWRFEDLVKQFYDRAGTLAKQGHTVDKVEIIVLGGTWSHYPRDYQDSVKSSCTMFANQNFVLAHPHTVHVEWLAGRVLQRYVLRCQHIRRGLPMHPMRA